MGGGKGDGGRWENSIVWEEKGRKRRKHCWGEKGGIMGGISIIGEKNWGRLLPRWRRGKDARTCQDSGCGAATRKQLEFYLWRPFQFWIGNSKWWHFQFSIGNSNSNFTFGDLSNSELGILNGDISNSQLGILKILPLETFPILNWEF